MESTIDQVRRNITITKEECDTVLKDVLRKQKRKLNETRFHAKRIEAYIRKIKQVLDKGYKRPSNIPHIRLKIIPEDQIKYMGGA